MLNIRNYIICGFPTLVYQLCPVCEMQVVALFQGCVLCKSIFPPELYSVWNLYSRGIKSRTGNLRGRELERVNVFRKRLNDPELALN